MTARCRLGWGAWIRTRGWRNQNPLPYHLATPHSAARVCGPLGNPHAHIAADRHGQWSRDPGIRQNVARSRAF